MRNKTVSNSKGLANWLDDFITGLASKPGKEVIASEELNEELPSEPEKEKETTATININDLDKVVWNDETFRVLFDENGANVINEFGNSVTFLKGLKNIEEVDHALNDKQVVTSAEEVKDEDVVNGQGGDSEFEDALKAAVAAIPSEEEVPAEESKEEVVAGKEDEKEDCGCDEKGNVTISGTVTLPEDEKEEKVMEAIIAGFDEIEKRLAAVEQLYARNPQFNDDDVASKVKDEEDKHFMENADETQKEIANEHQHDITTPAGRIELSVHTQQPSGVEQMVNDHAKQPEATEPKTEEAPKKEAENEDVSDDQFEKLTGKDEKIFQNGVCPETGEELVKSKTAGVFLGIYSPKGGTEYAVNLQTGDIYRYKG